MASIEDQIREARAQRARAQQSNTPSEQDDNNNSGIQFGTSVAYDDAYADNSGGGDKGEFVTSLPTLDEERRMMMGDDDDYDAGRLAEMQDEGRIGSHPSTLAAMKVRMIVVCHISFDFFVIVVVILNCISLYYCIIDSIVCMLCSQEKMKHLMIMIHSKIPMAVVA